MPIFVQGKLRIEGNLDANLDVNLMQIRIFHTVAVRVSGAAGVCCARARRVLCVLPTYPTARS